MSMPKTILIDLDRTAALGVWERESILDPEDLPCACTRCGAPGSAPIQIRIPGFLKHRERWMVVVVFLPLAAFAVASIWASRSPRWTPTLAVLAAMMAWSIGLMVFDRIAPMRTFSLICNLCADCARRRQSLSQTADRIAHAALASVPLVVLAGWVLFTDAGWKFMTIRLGEPHVGLAFGVTYSGMVLWALGICVCLFLNQKAYKFPRVSYQWLDEGSKLRVSFPGQKS